MGSGSLSNILLGVGLGILAISGFIVTGLFGQYHSKSRDDESKLYSKLQTPSDSSIRSICLAIAVLGCLSGVAAIVAIVLSIFLEGQTMVLIIVGAVSALLAFGCIVAEGVYTKKITDFYDQVVLERDNNDVQDHIIKTLKYLLNLGRTSILDNYDKDLDGNTLKLPETDAVLAQLGKSIYRQTGEKPDDRDEIFTYQHLWEPDSTYRSSYYDYNLDDYVYLSVSSERDKYYNDYYYIFANTMKDKYSLPIATLTFDAGELEIQPNIQVCWPDVPNISTFQDIECKFISTDMPKVRTYKNYTYHSSSNSIEDASYPPFIPKGLSENIYKNVGDYYSPLDAYKKSVEVNYLVANFPIMFHALSKEDIRSYYTARKEGKTKPIFVSTTSDKEYDYKISAKDYINYRSKSYVDEYKEGNDEYAIVTLQEVNSYGDLISICNKYINDVINEKVEEQEPVCVLSQYDSSIGEDEFKKVFDRKLETFQFSTMGIDMRIIMSYLNGHYDDYNKGKFHPKYKDYLKKRYAEGQEIKDFPKSYYFYQALYTTALIHLIVQIIGIVFWAIGRFIGLATGGGSDAKTQSEGEA